MLSPAQKHFQDVMARRYAAGSTTPRERTAYEVMLHRLRLDKAELSRVMSNAAKAKLKALKLPEYAAWINGALSADRGGADEVITTLMTWHIDAGEIQRAIDIGAYILRHGLPMPDNYRRTPATVLVEEICAPVLAKFKAHPNVAPLPADLLHKLASLTANEDMPDEVRAKLFKCLGYSLRIETDIESKNAGLSYLRQATALDSKIGVQRDIELLVRDVKKGEQPVTHEALESESPPDTAPSTVPDVTQAKPSNEVPLPPASPKKPAAQKKTAAKKSAPKNKRTSRTTKS
ncbi:terminase [Hafnia alvei]|uniref:phage terminase small subunit n=1 Tax=Hafnia alvei TaxID=569 RepID=UPI000C9F55B2|nr:phage terminase small subunit [Hafnia alvei]MBI0277278.1 terminase [Hafnia alvei]PNK97566.1 terminase [Hafnia alvei]